MPLQIPRGSGPQLFNDGYSVMQGADEAVIRNIQAIQHLGDIVRTCMGPHGSNKIVVNRLDKVFLTSDTATIVKELDVVHPAAKLCVMAAQQQETEMGDGTNFVLVMITEWLKRAEELLRIGQHPSEILQGYELAAEQALKLIDELAIDSVSDLRSSEELVKALRTCIASKQCGNEELLADLVAEAVLTVLPKDVERFNVDNVRVVKVMGSTLSLSHVVKGMVFPREPKSFVKNAKDAKVAVFTGPVDISQTETKGTVLLKSAQQMLDFSRGEEEQLEKAIREIHDAGVRVIVSGATFGDLALHYIDRYGLVAVSVQSKFDLQRLCRVCGATPLVRVGVPMPEEMGFVNMVETIEIGADRVVCFRQDSAQTRTATVLLRGATKSFLDDVERAVDDGVSVVKALIKDGKLVAGAGAVEMQLSRRIQEQMQQRSGTLQLPVQRFAEAFEVVPRTLAENSGLNANEVLSRLIAAHARDGAELSCAGVDIDDASDGVVDARDAGILDSLAVKKGALRLAVDAALTVLRIDQVVMSRPAGGLKPPQRQGHWDDD